MVNPNAITATATNYTIPDLRFGSNVNFSVSYWIRTPPWNGVGDLGDLQGARSHFERALRIFQDFLGENHPSTVLVRNNLQSLYET